MKYFSYDPENGFELHDTAAMAEKCAAGAIPAFLDDCWDESVEHVCWGEIHEAAAMCNKRPDNSGNYDYLCDYELARVEPVARTAPGAVDQASQAARDVLAERRRQMEKEGWTPEHDDEHNDASLADAASCYARAWVPTSTPSMYWPWSLDAWKPKDRRSNLVRAAALLIAEIERIDRAYEQHLGADGK